MPLVLSHRWTDGLEQMDREDCDPIRLHRTYRQFEKVNGLISGWRRVYKRYIRPVALRLKHCSLLDIGFGGGDIPIALHQWARRDRINLAITAIEEDARALQYVEKEIPKTEGIVFQRATTGDLIRAGHHFDFVTSNHLLHHVAPDKLALLGLECRQLGDRVIHNDIERGDLAYVFFNMFPRPFFRDSFIVEDGLRSIRRSYTAKELRGVGLQGYRVRRLFPYRLLLIHMDSDDQL